MTILTQRNTYNRVSARHGKSKRRVFRGRGNTVHNKSESNECGNEENTPKFSNVHTSSRFNTKVHTRSKSGKSRSAISKNKFRRSRAPHRAAFSSKHRNHVVNRNKRENGSIENPKVKSNHLREDERMIDNASRPMAINKSKDVFNPLFEKMDFSYFSQAPESVIFGHHQKQDSVLCTPKSRYPKNKKNFHISHHESMFSMSPKNMIFQG